MHVSVHPGGIVRVTVPEHASQSAVDRFLAKYSQWIARAREKTQDMTVIAARKALIATYKKQAESIAKDRVAHYAKRYGVSYGSITIRAQKSRWGSCSRKGDLSFNYKIASLPVEMQDYIIVHEVCHLLQFNHSRAFWDQVAREIPNHRALRQELRRAHFRFT